MVGLHSASGDHRVGTLSDRVSNQELEFARLVATERQASKIVTLDPDVWASQGFA